MRDKFLDTLGMAKKSGGLVCGAELVIASIRKGRVLLALYAEDASGGTKKKISDKCSFYNVAVASAGRPMSDLSHAAGLIRPTAVMGVTNKNFADILLNIINQPKNN